MENLEPEGVKGKIVYDRNNVEIGAVDQYWIGWEEIGYVFGVKLKPKIATKYVKSSTKLMPVHYEDIANVAENVNLNKTIDELSAFWNQNVIAGENTYPAIEFWQKPVCDSENTKIGTIYASVRTTPKMLKLFGLCLEPEISEKYAKGTTNLMPINTEHILRMEETVFLNKTVAEISRYWRETTE